MQSFTPHLCMRSCHICSVVGHDVIKVFIRRHPDPLHCMCSRSSRICVKSNCTVPGLYAYQCNGFFTARPCLLNTPPLTIQCEEPLALTLHGSPLHKCTMSCHRYSAVGDDAIQLNGYMPPTAVHVQQDIMHLCRVQLPCAWVHRRPCLGLSMQCVVCCP